MKRICGHRLSDVLAFYPGKWIRVMTRLSFCTVFAFGLFLQGAASWYRVA
jgi:hypothetical protein